jgi:hypothetical protein
MLATTSVAMIDMIFCIMFLSLKVLTAPCLSQPECREKTA